MIINKIKIDSAVFGKCILEISDLEDDIDIKKLEYQYIKEYKPWYVSSKVPVENLHVIHLLEINGFQFVEFQIRENLKLKESYKPVYFEPYKLNLVEKITDLDQILHIASTTFKHDRFSNDPNLPANKSGERYQEYIKKSFSQPDEFVYQLINTKTNEVLGFKTHKIIAADEAVMFLGGIANQYKKTPLPVISNYLEFNILFEKGIRKITSHISGSNYGVLNLEVKEFGYKVTQAYVILRKIYDN